MDKKTISEYRDLASYLRTLSGDWRDSHNIETSNDLREAADAIGRLATVVEIYQSRPDTDPVDMLSVWEYYIDNEDELEKLPTEGYAAHRQYVVDHLTAFCDHWWLYVHAFFGYADSYDWEFLPIFLGRLDTHDVGKITPVQIEAALAAVISSDSLKLHNLKWEQGL